MTTPQQLREKLRGPVVAMTTHFKEDCSSYLAATVQRKRYWACLKALHEMVGLPGGPMRPPLVDCTPGQRQELRRVCTQIGLMQKDAHA